MFTDFATPQWLLAGAATVAALALAMVYAERRRRRALRRFAAATPISTTSRARRWTRNALALAGVAFAFIALARPRGGYRLEQTPRQGIDLMFAVDTSKSMRASDLTPDRLTRAKLAVTDLTRKFPNSRVGLIAFAGGAFVQAPMTADHGVFLEALQSLDTDVIPRPGTDLSSAIRAASQAMASEPSNRKLLVLVSDGENLTGDALAAAREAAKEGLRIFTIGVGTAHGDLIEITSPDGTRELVRDEQGNPVRSTLDETTLRSIAQVTNGEYEPLGADGRGLDRLYNKSLSTLPKATGTTARKVYNERYQFPLAIALACLLLELVMRDRKRPRPRPRNGGGRTAAVAIMTMLAIPAVASANPAPVDTYNGGTEAYRRGDFEAAQKQFDGALHTKNVELQADAYYNLGNARYRVGEHALKADKAQAIAAWKTAVEAYDAALALEPKDADAKFNRDLVARKLAALEQEQKQDGSQSGQQQTGSKNGQQSNGSSSGQQSNGSSNGQQSNGSSNGQQQNGSSNGQQSNGSSNGQQQGGSQNGQQSNGSSNGQQQGGSQNGQQSKGQQSNGSSAGQQSNGSSNGQQSNGSSNGQQRNGSQNGQQQNGQQSNGQQSNGQQSNGQQSNGQQPNGQQPNGQQSNGQQPNGQQPNGQQPNGQQPNGQQPNGQQSNGQQPNGQQSNGQQPNGQQPNIRQSNDQQSASQQSNAQPQNAPRGPQSNAPQGARGLEQSDGSAGDANDNRSATNAERQAQAARVHAPDAAAPRDGDTSTAGAASGNQPTTAAERAADNARRAAGQLTRREAIQLLDAAEGELKPMPIDGKARAGDRATTSVKDW